MLDIGHRAWFGPHLFIWKTQYIAHNCTNLLTPVVDAVTKSQIHLEF